MSISNLLSLQFIVTFWTEFSTWNIQIPKKIPHNSCGIHLLSCQITGGLESPLSHFALINQRGDSFNLFEARQFSVLRKPYKIRQKILKSIIFQTLFCKPNLVSQIQIFTFQACLFHWTFKYLIICCVCTLKKPY